MAARAVRRRLAEQRPADLARLDSLCGRDVVAFKGTYDQAEETLKVLGVPATVEPGDANAALRRARVAFVNCANGYDAKLVEALAGFVNDGGQLVTSDWALDGVIEKAFPGLVRWNRKGTSTETVGVEPAADSLWSDVVVLGADPQWWLWGSHPVEVVDRERVRVEAASHDLLVKYDAPAVAVAFGWGRGRVFHVISHFWAKTTATPTPRHQGTAEDFLRAGMRLSEAGIADVLTNAGKDAETVNFAALQSAVTATELVAQLCARSAAAA
jgi:hypothetical protein